MESGASRFLHAIRSFSLSVRRRGATNAENCRLLLCGPEDITHLLQQTYSSKFTHLATSLEVLSMANLQGLRTGFSRLSVSMNDAFVLVFYMDNEDCFQSISAFREVIINAKGEDTPLLVVGYNRATSAPRIMGPETADCLMTIEWGVGYTEVSVGRPEGLERVFQEIFKIIKQKYDKTTELQ